MGLLGGIIGGVVGALLGAAAWAAVAYYTHYELGIIAWGIGLAAGAGVAIGTRGGAGLIGGVIGVVCALGGIAGGKYAAVHFQVEQKIASQSFTVTEGRMIEEIAEGIVEEREKAGKQIKWPTATPADERTQADYPKEIWSDANARWTKLSEGERTQRLADAQDRMNAAMVAFKQTVKESAFKASFGVFDILWVILAAASAFKLGSGNGGD